MTAARATPSPAATTAVQNDETSGAGRSFWLLLQQTALLAAVAHGAFVVLFAAINAPLMAWINVGSVGLFAAAYLLLQSRRNRLGIRLIVCEIVLHAGLALYVIGWDSGFHYYLILMPPVIMLSPMRHRHANLLLVALACATYLLFDVLFRTATPLHTLPATLLTGLRYFNVTMTFGILSILAALFLRLVKRAEQRLSTAAATDVLTGLLNRRRGSEVIQHWAARRKREAAPLCFVLCDVDHFKRINDEHGHDGGDRMLVEVADAMRGTVRELDSVVRWGGEEFLIVMPNTTLEAATGVAERLRQRVAELRIPQADGLPPLQASLTLGVAEHRVEEDPETTIARADQALYQGKHAGRDRVVTAAAA